MSNYILTRESREGRQSPEDVIHILKEGDEKTMCQELSEKQLRTVRTLSVFMNESNVCANCAEYLDGIN